MAHANRGILFNGTLEPILERHRNSVDFVSVIPERFWTDRGRGHHSRFQPLPDEVTILDRIAGTFPLVAHGIALSIGSGSTFDFEHVRHLAEWHRRYGFKWISEHLSAVRVRTNATPDHHAGLALPLPWDREVLEMLCARVIQAQEILGTSLLFENGVVHTRVPDTDMSEAEFLNELCERTSCGVLLDLHNVHVNSVNFSTDPGRFVGELNLNHVREIHIAGGNRLYGVYLDSHAGPCPPEVWRLLASVLPRCTNLRGVTYEFHESYYPLLGERGVLSELMTLNTMLQEVTSCLSPASSEPLLT